MTPTCGMHKREPPLRASKCVEHRLWTRLYYNRMTTSDSGQQAADQLNAAGPQATLQVTAMFNSLRSPWLREGVLVARRRRLEEWAVVPCTVYHTAATESRGLYGRA